MMYTELLPSKKYTPIFSFLSLAQDFQKVPFQGKVLLTRFKLVLAYTV